MNAVTLALFASLVAIPALAQHTELAAQDTVAITRLVNADFGLRARWMEVGTMTPQRRAGRLEVIVQTHSCLTFPYYAIAARTETGWVLVETGLVVEGARRPDTR